MVQYPKWIYRIRTQISRTINWCTIDLWSELNHKCVYIGEREKYLIGKIHSHRHFALNAKRRIEQSWNCVNTDDFRCVYPLISDLIHECDFYYSYCVRVSVFGSSLHFYQKNKTKCEKISYIHTISTYGMLNAFSSVCTSACDEND